MKKQYFKFTENNDWEGETWNFYIPMSVADHEKISEIIKDKEFYSLSKKPLAIDEIKSRLKRGSKTSCLCDENLCSEKFKIPKKIDWDEDDPFYKGGLWEVLEHNPMSDEEDDDE